MVVYSFVAFLAGKCYKIVLKLFIGYILNYMVEKLQNIQIISTPLSNFLVMAVKKSKTI